MQANVTYVFFSIPYFVAMYFWPKFSFTRCTICENHARFQTHHRTWHHTHTIRPPNENHKHFSLDAGFDAVAYAATFHLWRPNDAPTMTKASAYRRSGYARNKTRITGARGNFMNALIIATLSVHNVSSANRPHSFTFTRSRYIAAEHPNT